jgi:hypothetical protein
LADSVRFPAIKPHPLAVLFDGAVSPAFLEESIRTLAACYGKGHDHCNVNFAKQEAHDLYGHYRRALVEQEWRTLAHRFPGLQPGIFRNSADNYYHTRIITGNVVLVECCVRRRGELVRHALFRQGLARTNQLALSLFADEQPIDPDAKVFAILQHGADHRFPNRLAFVDIEFPNSDCTGYVTRIDLLKRFPELAKEVRPDLVAAHINPTLPRLREFDDPSITGEE